MGTFERGSWVKHTRIPSPYRRHSASFPISFVPNLFRSQTLVSRIHANIRWTSATFPLLLGLIRMVSPIAAPAAEMQIATYIEAAPAQGCALGRHPCRRHAAAPGPGGQGGSNAGPRQAAASPAIAASMCCARPGRLTISP
jgi:hypothetical protein